MTFWEHFLRLLFKRPTPALAALYWHVTRRRLRARNRLVGASDGLSFMYDKWIAGNEDHSHFDVKDGDWAWHPTFSIILHGTEAHTEADRSRSLRSINQQIYRSWDLVETTGSIGEGLAAAEGDYVLPLRIGDELSEAALFRLAEALQANRGAAILYGDEDRLDDRGRRVRPWFKPGWNSEMFLALDYLSSAAATEGGLAKRLRTAKDVGDLMLAATSAADGSIVHVPHILCHVSSRSEDAVQRLDSVREHLKPLGAVSEPGPFETVKVVWPLPAKLPLVTLIVPTRDKIEVLQPCVESVLSRTDYPNFELLIIDNESTESRTADFLRQIEAEPRVRIQSFEGPFNFSAMNNRAAREARGDYVCLLNNDTEVLEPGWLTEMVRYAVKPDVGAVGAKLLYDDGTIQHAGVVVGIGGAAGHAHRSLRADRPGYFRQPHVAQFVSAITAACLLVSKEKFLAVGGLDEEQLQVAFNDVDLCLKLQAAGWKNVYVPHAVLIHHESKTRGQDISRKNIERFRREVGVLQERWATRGYQDPFHNPNLDQRTETFIVRV